MRFMRYIHFIHFTYNRINNVLYTLYKLSGVVTERGEKVLKTRPKTQGFMVVRA